MPCVLKRRTPLTHGVLKQTRLRRTSGVCKLATSWDRALTGLFMINLHCIPFHVTELNYGNLQCPRLDFDGIQHFLGTTEVHWVYNRMHDWFMNMQWYVRNINNWIGQLHTVKTLLYSTYGAVYVNPENRQFIIYSVWINCYESAC
jgi:hypothetical protein